MARKATTKTIPGLPTAMRRRFHFRITLRHVTPAIWREIAVPEEFALDQLHRCIQLSFGWLDYHLYQFEFGKRRFRPSHAETPGEDTEATGLDLLELKRGARLTYTYDW